MQIEKLCNVPIETYITESNEQVWNEDDFSLPEYEEQFLYDQLGFNNETDEPVPYYPVDSSAIKEVKKEVVIQRATKGTCVTCFENMAKYIMDPCGHACFCKECNEVYKEARCPCCKELIESRIKLA